MGCEKSNHINVVPFGRYEQSYPFLSVVVRWNGGDMCKKGCNGRKLRHKKFVQNR